MTIEATEAAATTEAAAPTTTKAAGKKVAKKAAGKKAVTKKSTKKAAAKKAPKAEAAPREGLTKNQTRVLQALSKTHKDGKTMDRATIKEKTGIVGGLHKVMGSPSKEDFGAGGNESLEAAGLVGSKKDDGARGRQYWITAKGLKALESGK